MADTCDVNGDTERKQRQNLRISQQNSGRVRERTPQEPTQDPLSQTDRQTNVADQERRAALADNTSYFTPQKERILASSDNEDDVTRLERDIRPIPQTIGIPIPAEQRSEQAPPQGRFNEPDEEVNHINRKILILDNGQRPRSNHKNQETDLHRCPSLNALQ